MQGVGVLYIRWVGDDGEGRYHSITSSSSIYFTLLYSTLQHALYQLSQPNQTLKTPNPLKMPTSHISTPLNGVAPEVVIAALHNHELMIKTLCPSLISYAFDSGDAATTATYSVTDKKPIGQVCPPPQPPLFPTQPN
jgi:hypothetical protein